MDGIERRSRLVSLAYQMIGAVDAPPTPQRRKSYTLAVAFNRK